MIVRTYEFTKPFNSIILKRWVRKGRSTQWTITKSNFPKLISELVHCDPQKMDFFEQTSSLKRTPQIQRQLFIPS
jgi:hypothetical protein